MIGAKEVVRMVINSKNKITPLDVGESNSNFRYSINYNLSRITEIMIERIELPYSFYAINSNNNVLKFNNNASSITVTPGNYNIATLSAELSSKIQVIFGGTPSVTFNTTTLKLSIAGLPGGTIIDSSASVPSSTLSTLLGFRVSSTAGTSATADSVLNISGPNYILISSAFLTRFIQHKVMYSDSTYQDVFWAIPVNTSSGNVIFESPLIPIRLNRQLEIKTTDIIDIQLYDDDYNLLDLNGADWSIQLVLKTE
jgi:hypothetical protein